MVDELQLRRLLDLGRVLVSDLDTTALLDHVLDAARELTGARFAALGVLNEDRTELAEFRTAGISEQVRSLIGELPRGRGVLGVLISDPRPLRLRDVADHPRSYGVPEGHPPIGSFLGVPVMIRGKAWGNLYLADKQGAAEFTDADEEAIVVLARYAAVAIENARLYEDSERRRAELERAVRGLQATRDVAIAIGSSGIDRVLELIVRHARELVEARSVLIMLRDQDELVIAAGAGQADIAPGRRVPISESTTGQVLERGEPERISDVSSHLRVAPADLGVEDAHTALLVPMLRRGVGVGILAVFDRGESAAPFREADEQLLRSFAASAANAITIARSVESDRLRASLAAADAERKHWARELHDETLQVLGGLRVLLSGALRRGDAARYEAAMRTAIEGIEEGIDGLRAIITDLRPAALDELGLGPAIETVLDRRRGDGLEITADVSLPDRDNGFEPELESVVYRLVQESLTNVVKHADASHVDVAVSCDDRCITVDVQDDGTGFDPGTRTNGFGLAGMRERVQLSGGELEIDSGLNGTHVHAVLPLHDGHRFGTG